MKKLISICTLMLVGVTFLSAQSFKFDFTTGKKTRLDL